MAAAVEAELLVLGADAPIGSRLRASFQIGDELVPRLDGRALLAQLRVSTWGELVRSFGCGLRAREAPLLHVMRVGEYGMGAGSLPIAESRIDKRQRRDRRGVGPHHARPERDRQHEGLCQEKRPLLLARTRPPGRSARRADASLCCSRAASGEAMGAASSAKIRSRFVPAGENIGKLLRLSHLRHPQDAALLGGLDGIGDNPRSIDPLGDRAAGDHGHERAAPSSVAFCAM